MKKIFLLSMFICLSMTACESESTNENKFSPEITASVTSMNFSKEGGKRDVKIEANIEYDIDITENWITAEKINGGIKVNIESNNEYSERYGYVKVYNVGYETACWISITQEPRPYKVGELVSVKGAEGVVYYMSGNTIKIISAEECNKNWFNACTWCTSYGYGYGYGYGWKMPTIDELKEVYNAKSTIDDTLETNGYDSLDGIYWSKDLVQNTAAEDLAWALVFSGSYNWDGKSTKGDMYDNYNARAITTISNY